MYNDFKVWFRDNYPGERTPDQGFAKSNFMKHLGKMIGGRGLSDAGWMGPKLYEEIEAPGPSSSNSFITK